MTDDAALDCGCGHDRPGDICDAHRAILSARDTEQAARIAELEALLRVSRSALRRIVNLAEAYAEGYGKQFEKAIADARILIAMLERELAALDSRNSPEPAGRRGAER